METIDAARRWAREWERAWREHDAARVAALYADGVTFRSAPFRELDDPGAFAAAAFESEEPDPLVRFAEPVVVSGDRAAVEWWAIVRESGGPDTTIAGISLLRFGQDGLVVEERDVWNQVEERREPHKGWGS